jgi:GntR family transcriptional regulator
MTSPLSYRDIADEVQRRIESGDYPPDSPIPSYASLAAHYAVSVSTVQRAMMLLRDRGMVVGRQGRGVFVVGPG